MSSKKLPAFLDGTPVLAPSDVPEHPKRGQLEKGVAADVTDGPWFGFGEDLAGEWATTLGVLAARMTGDRYGVPTTSGTMGIGVGLRAQLRRRLEQGPDVGGRSRPVVGSEPDARLGARRRPARART